MSNHNSCVEQLEMVMASSPNAVDVTSCEDDMMVALNWLPQITADACRTFDGFRHHFSCDDTSWLLIDGNTPDQLFIEIRNFFPRSIGRWRQVTVEARVLEPFNLLDREGKRVTGWGYRILDNRIDLPKIFGFGPGRIAHAYQLFGQRNGTPFMFFWAHPIPRELMEFRVPFVTKINSFAIRVPMRGPLKKVILRSLLQKHIQVHLDALNAENHQSSNRLRLR